MTYRSFTETIPMTVIEADCEGDMEVRFNWSPGQAPSGMSGPPENYDPGSADEFCITGAAYVIADTLIPFGLAPHEEERIIDHLDAEWERPDDEAQRADYLRDQRRDEQMERRA